MWACPVTLLSSVLSIFLVPCARHKHLLQYCVGRTLQKESQRRTARQAQQDQPFPMQPSLPTPLQHSSPQTPAQHQRHPRQRQQSSLLPMRLQRPVRQLRRKKLLPWRQEHQRQQSIKAAAAGRASLASGSPSCGWTWK